MCVDKKQKYVLYTEKQREGKQNFLLETRQARRQWNRSFKVLT